ncbi:arylsulfatase I-like [Gigantopelta aegis]|uniref:arylsulfatase I-like n=1 Tax=Gigantopelta aegis TaxID=1735272 RepID=UPI001B88AE3C|nr:arylsulfatase I-like [Gigantopelta aegis]
MAGYLWSVICASWLCFSPVVIAAKNPPHIVFIVADDLGWNDVGWRNPKIKTPHLDRLARHGVILNSSYVQPVCTPSRSSFLTGYYPFKQGLQSGIFPVDRANHLPSWFPTLPQKLKARGYATHMVGKWHLGFCNWKYTPTYRGFDSFLGFYSGSEDYYSHMRAQGDNIGLDFRFNETAYDKDFGEYSSFVFAERAVDVIRSNNKNNPLFLYISFQAVHSPLQAPRKYLEIYKRQRNKPRRIYSAMVSAMDAAIGVIMQSLRDEGYMKNLLIVFTTDNGGATYAGGNNMPLRGAKNTLWEGGTRATSFVYSKTLLKKKKYTHNGLFHAVDWFPTLLTAAGEKTDQKIDGVNQWMMLRKGTPSKRREVVYNIDDVRKNAAIRMGHMKLLEGQPGHYNDWYPLPSIWTDKCMYKKDRSVFPRYQLYNITADPSEKFDIASKYPEIVTKLKHRLNKHRTHLVPTTIMRRNRKSNPKYYGGVWSPGWC